MSSTSWSPHLSRPRVPRAPVEGFRRTPPNPRRTGVPGDTFSGVGSGVNRGRNGRRTRWVARMVLSVAQDDVPQENRPQDAVPAQALTGDELALRRRVSDLEREEVADVLRESAGEGRLAYAELAERARRADCSQQVGRPG